MPTKSTGDDLTHMKTYAVGKGDSVAKHNINEGAAREPMYKAREMYDGKRMEVPSDHKYSYEDVSK